MHALEYSRDNLLPNKCILRMSYTHNTPWIPKRICAYIDICGYTYMDKYIYIHILYTHILIWL